jgi:hypothetical protein
MKNVGTFTTIWNNLPPFGIFYGRLVLFVVIWYIFLVLVCLDQEKSCNPGMDLFVAGDHTTGVWVGGSDNGHIGRWAWFPTGFYCLRLTKTFLS